MNTTRDEDEDSQKPKRRSSDIVTGFLDRRIDAVESHVAGVNASLDKHVAECAAMQKKVYGIVIFLAGWTVAHSPEGLKVIFKALEVVGL